jgi:hypothetical protein
MTRPQTYKPMKKIILTFAILAVVSLPLLASDAKDYQVTGPVLEVNASYIVVQKDDQKWQIAVGQSTKGDKPKVWRQGHGLLQDDGDGNRDEAGQEIIYP